MQSKQTANYVQRIERAIALVQAKLVDGEVPALTEVASAAALSEYHFHRIYRLMTGESLGQTIARVRVGGSLPALRDAHGIARATGLSGYATSQAFARAVKALTGYTPSQLRDDAELRDGMAEKLSRPEGEVEADGPPMVEVAIVSFEPVQLAARHNIGDYTDLDEGFAVLFTSLLQQVEESQITGLWGIPYDDPRDVPAANCRFDCGVTLSTQFVEQDGISRIVLSPGDCLRLRVAGDYDALHERLDALYLLAIAADAEISSALPAFQYHSDPESDPEEELVADLFLSLSEKEKTDVA